MVIVVINLDKLEVGVGGPGLERTSQLCFHKLLASQLVSPGCQADQWKFDHSIFWEDFGWLDLLVGQSSFPPSLGTYHVSKSGFDNVDSD